MARQLQSDKVLFGAVVGLVLFGALMVFSASAVMAADRYNNGNYFLFRQLAWAGVGLIAVGILMHTDYRRLASPMVVFPALALEFILLVLVLFVDRSHNTHRWFHIGVASFQPSELAKIILTVFLAFFLDLRKGEINDWKHTLAPILLVAGLMGALVLKEPDLGTTLAMCLILAAMLFSAGLNLRYFVVTGIAGLVPLYFLIFHSTYRSNRISAFLHPYADPLGKGFQILQSYIAVGTGGITGVGLMEGKQKLFFLPEPQTDFIFSVVGEELGLLGCLAVAAIFAIILIRGLRASAACRDDFGRLLAIGLTVMIVGQALVNMSVVLGLLPTKGIPLPFVSYGGSSLLVNLVAVGILLNISQQAS
ncbi:MAG: putative lipid II flippase FtsW [Acidobacteriota bacterium]|nr:putative lipid II flippase FtsW [Acidobacteriota bacterium]